MFTKIFATWRITSCSQQRKQNLHKNERLHFAEHFEIEGNQRRAIFVLGNNSLLSVLNTKLNDILMKGQAAYKMPLCPPWDENHRFFLLDHRAKRDNFDAIIPGHFAMNCVECKPEVALIWISRRNHKKERVSDCIFKFKYINSLFTPKYSRNTATGILWTC